MSTLNDGTTGAAAGRLNCRIEEGDRPGENVQARPHYKKQNISMQSRIVAPPGGQRSMEFKPTPRKRFSVYVVGLNRAVLNDKRFTEENPQHNPIKPCVYVGMTGLTPQERFQRHKSGKQACKFVLRYGEYLKPRLYRRFNPMTYEEAVAMERELARRLRKRGYAVWQR